MNIFLLNTCPYIAARLHCDKHVIKMILETAQLLYTAWLTNHAESDIVWDPICPHDAYRKTHANHPSARWVRRCSENYHFTIKLGMALCSEYTRRYEKVHKCQSHLKRLSNMGYPSPIEKEVYDMSTIKCATQGAPDGCTDFFCALPDEVVVLKNGEIDAVATYTAYYKTKKPQFKMMWNKGKESMPVQFRGGRDWSPPEKLIIIFK